MAKKSKYISQYTGPEIDRGITKANNTYGGSYYDTANNTMLYFNTKEDLQEWISTGDSNLILDSTVMNFTNTIYQVKIDNLMGSKNLYFTTKEDKAEITVSFSTQKKGITESSWQDVIEDYNVSIYIDKGTTGSFTPYILDQFVMSGHTYTFDVKKVLATGSNRVRIIATGTESGEQTQGSEMFIVNLTSMYLSPSNFTWYKPFIEGETFALGGMNIGGNLNKVLKVKVSKEGYERLYEVNIGSNIYTTTAYVFNGLEFPEAGTGVYNVEMWLDANGLESDHLSYNIICVSAKDKFTARLVAIGDPAKTVYNFSDNKLFEYCVYNGGTATASPHIKVAYVVNTNPTTIINEDLVDVATASPLTYTASLEIEMEDESAALSLETYMTYGNEQMIVFPVDNSKSYPATTGAVFYLNPSARNNAQENREKIVNSINGAEIDAAFTRMAWTDGTDGWTTDDEGRKCLRLPAGCPMEMSYQPLASVSQKTIEFVYKVKNAADYDEPIFSIGDVYLMDGVKKVKDTDITFKDGYIKPDNTGIGTSTGYVYSNPIFLTKGESIHFKTTGHGFASVAKTNDAGTSYTKIYEVTSASTGNNSSYVTTVDYTATEDITISICRKTVGVESEIPYIIRIVPTEGGYNPQFRGIKITPKNILIHSRDLNVNDSLQDYNTTDEETLHILVTIIPNYKTNYGNLAQIYCNGDKVRSFSFETADRWDVQSNVKVGSEKADVFLYKMRVYDRGFESYDALKNYINSLPSTKAKEEAKVKIEAPLDDSYKLSYDECVKNGLNTMVIEILDQDQTVPSISHPSAKQCNLWVKINNPMDGELDEDFARFFNGEMIENQTIEGQGTTAMTYARWNFRWKLDETYNKRRITAKKNFASSMHSHKMGATRLFNDLHKKIVGANDVNGRVAVFQYPVYGFQKVLVEGTTDQYIYEPIGLYTIGPDKGDKKTFGFDNKAYKNTLVHLEGTDHTPKGVGFDYPYDELGYSGSAEALGAMNASGSVVAAWEVGAAGSYDPKDDPNEVKGLLDVEFAPAYNVVERNSTYILGVTETLTEINADIADWQARHDAEDRAFSDLEFFTDGVYDLYFYNTRTQKYEARGINMLTDLGLYASDVEGLSLEEKTELFKTKRRERFVALWETYWHKNDAIFHYAFILLLGATDNFKKNTYPYKFKAVSEGGKYRWRQDDLDTLFDINNQGLAAKIYSILVGDKTATGSGSIYRGDTSVFWSLIRECFGVEIKAMVHAIFDAMVELSPYGNNPLEKLVGCIRYYFWDKAQAYFPASAYSKDAEWTYEDTWAAGLYKEVNPLQQSLGGHKEAEMDWVTMRMLFCAMFFNYGPFGAVNDSFSDTSTGQIAYGGAGAKTYLITMACDGNPTILRGQSELVTFGKRVKAGETISLTVPNSSGADTRIYIQGVDWMEDIGDLSDLQVSADNPQLSVASKRLQRLKLGDEDASKVTTNVQALNFGDCPSMMVVDARNASSLTGTIDLSKMPRLMEAYFGGTGVKAINVPNGSKIAVLELGEETTQISLMNLKFMELEGFHYSELPKLEFLRIENCSQLNPFTMLKSIYNTDGNVIRDIRIIGFDVDGDASDVTMIANLANDVDKDGNPHIYNGIDAEGKPMDNSHPIIEGRLRVNGNIYKEDYEALKAVFANLAMEFLGFYVSFKDPEVLRILLANIATDDGIGLTTEDVAKVTTISNWFQSNTVIESFDEFKKFIGVTGLDYRAFMGCTSLKSLEMPDSVTSVGYINPNFGAFRNCTALERVVLSKNLKDIKAVTFFGCSSLRDINFDDVTIVGELAFYNCGFEDVELSMPNLTSLGVRAFQGTKIKKILDLGSITTVGGGSKPDGVNAHGTFSGNAYLESAILPETVVNIPMACFKNCTALVSCNIPESVTTLGEQAFYNCTALEFDELNLPRLTSLGQDAFYGVKIKKLVFEKLTTLPTVYSNTTENYGDKEVLEEVVFAEGMTTIPSASFRNYTKLTKVGFPQTLTTIEGNAFYNTSLYDEEVTLENLTTIVGAAFAKTGIKSFVAPNLAVIPVNDANYGGLFQDCKNLVSVEVDNVTSIGTVAFRGCSALERVKFSDDITDIGTAVFFGCPNLVGDFVLNSLTTIGKGAFSGTAITSFVANSLTSIPDADANFGGTFHNCTALAKVELGEVTYIGTQSFRNCTGLESIVLRALTPPTLASNAFMGASTTFVIYVPDASVEAYKTATNWSTYASRIYPMSVYENGGVENVITFADPAVEAIVLANWDNGDGCFMKDEAEAVTGIGAKFQGNTEITSFNEFGLFEGVTFIGTNGGEKKSAFGSCTALESIVLPSSLTRIYETSPTYGGRQGFYGCSNLKVVVFKGVTPPTVGMNTFAGTHADLAIYVPDESVDAYKETTNLVSYADRIKGISQLATGNPTLYAEIEEYL